MSRLTNVLAKSTKKSASLDASKAFIDANVLLEVLLNRKKQMAAAEILQNAGGRAAISTLSVHLFMHFGTKEKQDIESLREFLSEFEIIDMTASDVAWAFANRRNDDFEDALQVAAAVRSGCEVFYTLDQKLANDYQGLSTVKFVLVGGES